MNAQADIHILCMRHGETRYTGVFPDLTKQGHEQVRISTLLDVRVWIERHHANFDDLAIIASPSPRADGTSATLAEMLGYRDPIYVEPGLDAMKWRDPKRALAACDGLRGRGYINYETEPVFADPEIFETQAEVRDRWYRYLAEFLLSAFLHGTPKYAIFVSHYEVLCNIVHDLFGIVASRENALRHAETITLSVTRSRIHPHIVYLAGEFRGQQSDVAAFDLTSCNLYSYAS